MFISQGVLEKAVYLSCVFNSAREFIMRILEADLANTEKSVVRYDNGVSIVNNTGAPIKVVHYKHRVESLGGGGTDMGVLLPTEEVKDGVFYVSSNEDGNEYSFYLGAQLNHTLAFTAESREITHHYICRGGMYKGRRASEVMLQLSESSYLLSEVFGTISDIVRALNSHVSVFTNIVVRGDVLQVVNIQGGNHLSVDYSKREARLESTSTWLLRCGSGEDILSYALGETLKLLSGEDGSWEDLGDLRGQEMDRIKAKFLERLKSREI